MENSKIEWCHHTVNIWWGCYEVNKACDNCYAKTLANRYHGPDFLWQQCGPRMYIKSAFNDILRYQARAAKEGVVYRIFINSMSDLFEKSMEVVDFNHQPIGFEQFYRQYADVIQPFGDHQQLQTGHLRMIFFDLVKKCPNLFFILLTKRPSNILKYIPSSWVSFPPSNVIYMTSCPNQESLDILLPQLLKVPGKHGLSLEPLLGSIDLKLTRAPKDEDYNGWTGEMISHVITEMAAKINWVIVGGESGHDARPMHPEWAISLRNQCVDAHVPYFYKQWGEWMPYISLGEGCKIGDGSERIVRHTKETDKRFLKVYDRNTCKLFYRMGKHAAGSLLDGKEWKEFPV